jgi:glutamate carboxypeptidase
MTMGNLGNDILQLLQSQQDDMMDTLEALVRFETPSRDKTRQQPILQFLADQFADIRFHAEIFPGKQTGGFLLATPIKRTKRMPLQIMIGHADTVWPVGTLQKMPFEVDSGDARGPGIYDMKAGVTQMIFALKALQQLDLEPIVTPIVFINSDEEIGSRESSHAIRRLARIADRALILEPPLGTDGRLKTARKGIGRFTITVKGKAAHAGLNPEQGVSAIMELSHQIQQLFALNDPEKGITVNVGMIEGGISANVVAPESRAVADVRVATQKDAEWVTHKILGLKPQNPETKVEVEGGMGRPPMEATPRNQTLWHLAQSLGTSIGLELEQGMAGGGSDGNTTSQYTATLDGLGTVGDGAHAIHEHIRVDSLTQRTTLLALLLLAPPLIDKKQEV